MISFDSVPAAGVPGPRFWGLNRHAQGANSCGQKLTASLGVIRFVLAFQRLGHVAHQIAEVAPPVEQGHHGLLRRLARGFVAVIPGIPLRAQILIDRFPQPLEFFLGLWSGSCASAGSVLAHLVRHAHSSSCMFRSKTSSSRSAGTRDAPISPSRRFFPLCSSPISAPCSLSRYSVRVIGSLSVR